MKWITLKTYEYRKQSRSCWHFWFAWHPVFIQKYPDGAKIMIWLEKVLRKGTLHPGWWEPDYWTYKYRELIEKGE